MRREPFSPRSLPPDSRRLRIALRYFDLGGDKAKRAGANVASSATCNPISEPDLAMAIVDCVADRAKSSAGGDPIWNVGGPDAGLSMRDQGELLAKIVEKEPKLLAEIDEFDMMEMMMGGGRGGGGRGRGGGGRGAPKKKKKKAAVTKDEV